MKSFASLGALSTNSLSKRYLHTNKSAHLLVALILKSKVLALPHIVQRSNLSSLQAPLIVKTDTGHILVTDKPAL